MPVEDERLDRLGTGAVTRPGVARIGREVDAVVGKVFDERGAHALLDRALGKRELGCRQRVAVGIRRLTRRRRRQGRRAGGDEEQNSRGKSQPDG